MLNMLSLHTGRIEAVGPLTTQGRVQHDQGTQKPERNQRADRRADEHNTRGQAGHRNAHWRRPADVRRQLRERRNGREPADAVHERAGAVLHPDRHHQRRRRKRRAWRPSGKIHLRQTLHRGSNPG